jgi:hypothetical protein
MSRGSSADSKHLPLIAAKCQTSLVRSSPVRTFSITGQPRDRNFVVKYFLLRKALRLGPRARRGSQLARNVLGKHVLDVLRVTPVIRIAVLQPNKRGADIGRAMLDVVHDDRLFAPSWHEDLDGIVVIAVGALVERALDASPSASSGL